MEGPNAALNKASSLFDKLFTSAKQYSPSFEYYGLHSSNRLRSSVVLKSNFLVVMACILRDWRRPMLKGYDQKISRNIWVQGQGVLSRALWL